MGEASRDGKIALDLGHVPAGAEHVFFLHFQVNPTEVGRRAQDVDALRRRDADPPSRPHGDDLPLMDLVIRAAVAFLFVYLLTRIIGRRELSSLEPFDLIMLVMIGDLVQQGVTQNDFSVTARCSSAARSGC